MCSQQKIQEHLLAEKRSSSLEYFPSSWEKLQKHLVISSGAPDVSLRSTLRRWRRFVRRQGQGVQQEHASSRVTIIGVKANKKGLVLKSENKPSEYKTLMERLLFQPTVFPDYP